MKLFNVLSCMRLRSGRITKTYASKTTRRNFRKVRPRNNNFNKEQPFVTTDGGTTVATSTVANTSQRA